MEEVDWDEYCRKKAEAKEEIDILEQQERIREALKPLVDKYGLEKVLSAIRGEISSPESDIGSELDDVFLQLEFLALPEELEIALDQK